MTKDEARTFLIHAYVTMPDLPDDLRMEMAKLINPPPVKTKWWKRKRASKR